MTGKEIIELAKESGAHFQFYYVAVKPLKKNDHDHFSGYIMSYDQIQKFANEISELAWQAGWDDCLQSKDKK
jgi:hypothetical protein